MSQTTVDATRVSAVKAASADDSVAATQATRVAETLTPGGMKMVDAVNPQVRTAAVATAAAVAVPRVADTKQHVATPADAATL